ncbi:MAG: DoxX family protein [Bacteroidota bacterium]
MKKTNILYWTITGLFAAFMFFSAIPDILLSPEAVTFMGHLGYPAYFIPFIGVAKVLGVIAILIPGYPRIKEWAYAGLAYDLIGAIYSVIATEGFQPSILVLLLPIGFLIVSYVLYHKRLKSHQVIS